MGSRKLTSVLWPDEHLVPALLFSIPPTSLDSSLTLCVMFLLQARICCSLTSTLFSHPHLHCAPWMPRCHCSLRNCLSPACQLSLVCVAPMELTVSCQFLLHLAASLHPSGMTQPWLHSSYYGYVWLMYCSFNVCPKASIKWLPEDWHGLSLL